MATTKTTSGATTIRTVVAPRKRGAAPMPSGPRPIPKATRTLAGAFAALGDPRTLQVLGLLSSGGPATQAAICAAFGVDTDTANGCIATLKKQGWIEGTRAEGSRVYTYKLTEAGSDVWGKAQAFLIV